MKRFVALLLLLTLVFLVPCLGEGESEGEATPITSRCKITTGGAGERTYLTDGKYSTVWTPYKGGTATITLPEGESAGYVSVNWYTATTVFLVESLDKDGNVLRSETRESGHVVYQDLFTVPEAARTFRITISGDRCGIVEVAVYSRGGRPSALNNWQSLPEKVDLMVISAHYDDELLWFGGTIPRYVAEGKDVAVMYMTQSSPVRRNESLNAMWACGVRYHPIYLDMADERIPSKEQTLAHWGREIALGKIVEQIRRYRPEVIVTHDFNGEYGHNQHILTAELVAEAVTLAADAAQFPESAEKYGAWQAKKLYIHLYAENTIHMDWNIPMEELGGKTPFEVASDAFNQMYVSQTKTYSMEMGIYQFDSSAFGLYYSAVGADEAGDDFFEHIPS